MIIVSHPVSKLTELKNSTVVASIVGNFTKESNIPICEQLAPYFQGNYRTVVVDLSDMGDIDTSGIAKLVECLRLSTESGCNFRITGISKKVKEIFEMVRLSTLFETFELSKDNSAFQIDV